MLGKYAAGSTVGNRFSAGLTTVSFTVPDPGPPPLASDTALLYAPHGEVGGFFLPWREFSKSPFDFLRWRFSRNPYDKSRDPVLAQVANDAPA